MNNIIMLQKIEDILSKKIIAKNNFIKHIAIEPEYLQSIEKKYPIIDINDFKEFEDFYKSVYRKKRNIVIINNIDQKFINSNFYKNFVNFTLFSDKNQLQKILIIVTSKNETIIKCNLEMV